jgi:hypothetical protein
LALLFIENVLKLSSGSRDALILKAKILEALGRNEEAELIQDEADFLPEANWSERVPLQ